MKVAITSKIAHEWLAVCSQFGVDPEPVETFEMSGLTGPYRLSFFTIDDDSHLATWIRLVKPRWIDPVVRCVED
jgi:hypothetical protein